MILSIIWNYRYAGGNSLIVQPIPGWQKGISSFFTKSSKESENKTSSSIDSQDKGSSSSKNESFSKNGMISDDEDWNQKLF